jgi:hypothetical protein
MTTDADDNLISIPTPDQAARRLLCLMSLAARAFFEGQLRSEDPDEREEGGRQIDGLRRWLEQEDLLRHFSAAERPLAEKPPGEWNDRDRINSSWRAESAGVIAWSSRLVESIPPYDTEFRPRGIIEAIPQTGEPTAEWISAAAFRCEDDIAEAREIAEFWLWRSRTMRLQADADKHPKPTPPAKYLEYVRSAAKTGESNGWFTMIDDDFPAFGKAYANLSPAEHSRATSIAQERLWGLNWIRGYEADWDEVPLDT